jgi:hypothetical protein
MTRRVKVTGDLFHGQIPDGAIYVGRPAPGLRKSPYANPFKIGRDAVDAADAVRLYRQWLPGTDLYRDLSELAGHDLACWCQLDQPCHADVLLELANPWPRPQPLLNRALVSIATRRTPTLRRPHSIAPGFVYSPGVF